jgi:hypothetical protein
MQFQNINDYISDKITRSISEDSLYKSPLVYIGSYSVSKSYEEINSLGFQAKQRKSDVWKSEDVTLLVDSIHKIESGEIVPTVCFVPILYFYFLG